VARLPLGPGVYRFRDAAGRVLYVGRAVCLRRRVASYWGDLGDRGHLAAMVPRIARVEAVPCASAHEAAWLERNLLERRTPPWNRSRSGGQEAEVWIRLSQSADAAGVAVARRPRSGDRARYFGPYLGGQKARHAVCGLGRVQAELEAVDWITAEQKVTQAQPSDFDVLGWADGVLVRFEVRAGRLSGWAQRACAAPDLAPADPSPAWTDFARQTAELAALLRRCPA
jgi:hypothetical protein